jgi:hypothetical protein
VTGVKLRCVYLDQETDQVLAARAEDEGVAKSDLIRQYIAEGLQRPSKRSGARVRDE